MIREWINKPVIQKIANLEGQVQALAIKSGFEDWGIRCQNCQAQYDKTLTACPFCGLKDANATI